MTAFGTLYQEVQDSIARSNANDTFAVQIAKRGVNAGMMAAGLIFEPPEMRTSANLVALTTQEYVSTANLTRLQRIEEVYNETANARVYPLPFNMRNTFWIPPANNVQFYSMHGWLMYYKPTPTANNTLNIYFLQYPAVLSDANTAFPFPTLEAYVISFATEYAWACLEESDSQQIWTRVNEKLTLPEGMAAKIRLLSQEQYPTKEANSG